MGDGSPKDEPCRVEVFVQPLPEEGAGVQVSSESGFEAVGSRDGNELFYISARA